MSERPRMTTDRRQNLDNLYVFLLVRNVGHGSRECRCVGLVTAAAVGQTWRSRLFWPTFSDYQCFAMEETLKLNARELGVEATVESLKDLLVNQFRLARDPFAIDSQEPLFSAGVGLSSLEGLELLAVLEKKYGVEIKDLDYWMDESPTIDGVARYLIENSPASESTSS